MSVSDSLRNDPNFLSLPSLPETNLWATLSSSSLSTSFLWTCRTVEPLLGHGSAQVGFYPPRC